MSEPKYAKGCEEWKPGKQVLIDRYHPDGTNWEVSRIQGAKNSKKKFPDASLASGMPIFHG